MCIRHWNTPGAPAGMKKNRASATVGPGTRLLGWLFGSFSSSATLNGTRTGGDELNGAEAYRIVSAVASGTMPETGAVFAHHTAAGPTEFARILDTVPDTLGIRHVRFELFYQYRFKIMEAGERTLALPVFRKRFTRPVDLDAEEPETPAADAPV